MKTRKETKVFILSFDLFSEPNYQGNMSRYYLKGFNGTKISYGSKGFAKKYLTYVGAKKAGKRLQDRFPNARIIVHGFDYLGLPTESVVLKDFINN